MARSPCSPSSRTRSPSRPAPRTCAVERFTPVLAEADLAARIVEHVPASPGGVSLTDAKVVVSGGRGVGSAEGFAIVEELAGPARRRGRLLARRHERRLAPAHRPGRPDRHEDLAGPLHPLRDQRRDAAHRRLPGREEDPRDQRRPRGADPRQRRLRRHRRPARDRARDLRRDQKGQGGITSSRARVVLAALARRLGRALRARAPCCSGGSCGSASPSTRVDDVPRRLRGEAEIVLGQRKLFQRLVPGLMHAFIFWGFLVLLPTIVIALIGAVDRDSTLPWLGRQGWFAFSSTSSPCSSSPASSRRSSSGRSQRPARFRAAISARPI